MDFLESQVGGEEGKWKYAGNVQLVRFAFIFVCFYYTKRYCIKVCFAYNSSELASRRYDQPGKVVLWKGSTRQSQLRLYNWLTSYYIFFFYLVRWLSGAGKILGLVVSANTGTSPNLPGLKKRHNFTLIRLNITRFRDNNYNYIINDFNNLKLKKIRFLMFERIR